MNANQKSQGNKQSNKDANEQSASPGAEVSRQSPHQQSQQQGAGRGGARAGPGQQPSQQQGMPGPRQSNDAAGGLPRSPGGKRLASDQDMDQDTGLSNRANRQSAEDEARQSGQSNVGRRDDLTPD